MTPLSPPLVRRCNASGGVGRGDTFGPLSSDPLLLRRSWQQNTRNKKNELDALAGLVGFLCSRGRLGHLFRASRKSPRLATKSTASGEVFIFFSAASLASFVYVRVFTPVISGKLGFFFRWISTGDRFLLLGACGVSPIEAGARRYPFLDLTCKGWPWRVFTTRNFVTSDDLQTLCNFPCATRNVTPTVSTGGKLWDHSTCLVKDS